MCVDLAENDCKDITCKEKFLKLCEKISRPGMDELLKWLEESDFYTAPASTRYHGAYQGGLLEHSVDVYEELKKILSIYKGLSVSEESVIICSLFHDLCKVNFYISEKRNRKNALGQWESYDSYAIDEKFCYGGHGSKSVFILQNFIKLTPEEAVAIQCHMSSWEQGAAAAVGKAYEQYPFAWLLHVADEAATYMLNR